MILRGLALLFLFTLLGAPGSARAETTDNVLRELRSLNITSFRYGTLLTHFFREAEINGDIDAKINLTGIPLPGAVNIVVVEAPRKGASEIFVSSLGISVGELTRNVVAVNDDLIIVGEDALTQIYLSAYNNVLSVLYSGDLLGSVIFGDPYQYVESMTSYLDLSNTAALLSDDDVKYDDNAPPWSQHPLAVMREFSKSEIRMNEFFYLALSFVFQHEISHLEVGSPGGFVDFEGLIRDFYRWRRRGDEDAADKEALRKLTAAFQRYSGDSAMFTVTGLAINFRDQLLHRYFDGLGGVSAKDRFISFMHNGCNIRSVEANGLRRDNVNLVMAGYMSPLPILSETEFAKVKDAINLDETRSTHSHGLVRAITLTEAVTDFFLEEDSIKPSMVSTLNPYLEMLRSIATGRPYIGQDYYGGDTRVPTSDFLEFTDRYFNIQKSPSCEFPLNCHVGTSKNGARLEFAEKSDFLTYATLYLPIVVRQEGVAKGNVMTESAETLQELLDVPDVIVDRNFEFAKPEDAVKEATHELSSCGFHWSIYYFLQGFIEVSTWKGGEALQVRVLPAGYDVFDGP